MTIADRILVCDGILQRTTPCISSPTRERQRVWIYERQNDMNQT